MKQIMSLVLLLSLFVPVFSADELVLATNGVSSLPIVVFKNAPPRTREVADVLAGYIEKIVDVKPMVIEGEPSPIPERAI